MFLEVLGCFTINKLERFFFFFFLTRGPESDLTLILQWLNVLAKRAINLDLHRYERNTGTNYFTHSIDRDSTECDKPIKAK